MPGSGRLRLSRLFTSACSACELQEKLSKRDCLMFRKFDGISDPLLKAYRAAGIYPDVDLAACHVMHCIIFNSHRPMMPASGRP